MYPNNNLEEYPEGEGNLLNSDQQPQPGDRLTGPENRLLKTWESITRAGLGEVVLRLGTHILTLALILIVIWAMRVFYLRARVDPAPVQSSAALAADLPADAEPLQLNVAGPAPELPTFEKDDLPLTGGIARLASLHTELPAHPRGEVITYTVTTGDTIFGIAERFNLQPETILWGNYYTLADDPHNLFPGQVLNILPVNGTYHKWSAGEGLNGVAEYYGVPPETIITYEGNRLDPAAIGDYAHPNIAAGTMLIVPGGRREFISWSAPRISRDNPGVASILGPGSCGTVMDGAVGNGWYVWPANNHTLSGYDYSPSTNHNGIDIAGKLGDPIYAADSGVIVYAGWNNWGYGNVVVIDHGYGWQTLYAHMSYIGVGCGQSVYQGGVIGSFGSTGNSSGPHLHFEMLNELYGKVNPWDFLP